MSWSQSVLPPDTHTARKGGESLPLIHPLCKTDDEAADEGGARRGETFLLLDS